MTTRIDIHNVSKRFGTHVALDGVSLEVQPGELLALLGPSGSGKTTLLRVIAGLEAIDSGRVLFGEEDASRRHVRERGVGFVFQHYALFRHMTVFENVAFGLRVRPRGQRPDRSVIAERVRTLLRLVQLDWLADSYPSQLSGGQRQRAALARALAIEPRVLLLDEPFGALDAKVRKELRRWLRNLHQEVRLTSVFVTHDQEEALELADRVVVMAKGRIEQIGAPEQVYASPASAFVHEFLGDTNRLNCDVRDGHAVLTDGTRLGRVGTADGAATAYIRPHDITVTSAPDGAGTVLHAHATGPMARLTVNLAGTEIDVAVPTGHWSAGIRQGARVRVSVRTGMVFPAHASCAAPLIPLAPAPALVAVPGTLAAADR